MWNCRLLLLRMWPLRLLELACLLGLQVGDAAKAVSKQQ
jgi:hypothetical protein